MKIKMIAYQRLFTFGYYQNERIGFAAELGPDEDVSKAVLELAELTADIHHILDILRAVHDRLDWATRREDKEAVKELEEDRRTIKGLIREGRYKEVLEKYGPKYKGGRD